MSEFENGTEYFTDFGVGALLDLAAYQELFSDTMQTLVAKENGYSAQLLLEKNLEVNSLVLLAVTYALQEDVATVNKLLERARRLANPLELD